MKFFTTALLACTAIALAVSCSKKDKDSLSIKKIGGDYIMYEAEFPDTTYKFPLADGGHGKFVIQLLNDSTCTNRIMLIDADNSVEADTTWNCRVTKDTDGDIVLYDRNGLIAYIYEGYDMDFYALPGIRFSAKKK